MAKLENGFNGNAHGKMGGLVFYTLYGKPCVRTRPRKGKFKQTPARQRQQQRMNEVTGFLKDFKSLVKITFAGISTGRAPYHTAFSYNAEHALTTDQAGKWILDFSKVMLSAGPLGLPMVASMQRQEDGFLLSWSTEEGNARDTLVVMARTEETHMVEYAFTGIQRKKGTYQWELPLNGKVHVWIAFRSGDQQHMSNSVYLGVQ